MAVDSRTLALISFVDTYLCRELKIEQVGEEQHFPSSCDQQGRSRAAVSSLSGGLASRDEIPFRLIFQAKS